MTPGSASHQSQLLRRLKDLSSEPLLTYSRKVAEHLARAAPPDKTVLVDAFGGAGGNAIAFALSKRWKQIFAFEKDPQVLKCAKHNAEVYGARNKIFWTEGDCFTMISQRFRNIGSNVVIFASPPWGGCQLSDSILITVR